MTPGEINARANRAKDILNDPLMIEAFQLLEAQVIEEWEKCPVRDRDGREFLWMLYKNTRKFKGILQGFIERGRLASHEVKPPESFVQTALKSIRR